MTISQIANLMSVPIGIICLIIAIRAYYIYHLSRNDMLLVLSLSMASISLGTLLGAATTGHLGGNSYNGEFARAYGACSGGLFIFLSSFVKSNKQMQQLRRWQIIAFFIFFVAAFLTPLYPPIVNPWETFGLNGLRIIIYSCAFVRYALLYASKSTRFSLIMWISFLVLVTGYILNIPGEFQASLAFVTIVAATVRIIAYISLLVAYSVG
jgi:hypothetical protein